MDLTRCDRSQACKLLESTNYILINPQRNKVRAIIDDDNSIVPLDELNINALNFTTSMNACWLG